jgi:hypothetical protein
MTDFDGPEIVWRPGPHDISNANVTGFMSWLDRHRGIQIATWNDLWEWSVRELDAFWSAVWDYYDVSAARGPDEIVSNDAMPGTHWFRGAQLNYAQNVLARAPRQRPALVEVAEGCVLGEWSTGEVAGMVGALSQRLLALGVSPGDRVAAYLPNMPEAVIGLLATTVIGAVWSSCGPELGVRAVVDRFGQITPKVLLAVDGYRFAGAPTSAPGSSPSCASGCRPCRPPSSCASCTPTRLPPKARWRSTTSSPRRSPRYSPRYPPSTRCGSCSRRDRLGPRRGSCTATAESCSSTSSRWVCA